ncbi:MAG: hypothetical protein P4N60_13090 [Verrucomicrobiae bacterium]|nr:hypothetical protein [Verrucomicrobiae bacterium]
MKTFINIIRWFLFITMATAASSTLTAQTFNPYWEDLSNGPYGWFLGCDDNNIYSAGPGDGITTGLAKWNACGGSVSIGIFYGDLYSITKKGHYLYAAGQFSSVQWGVGQEIAATNIARCDLTTGEWSDLGFTGALPDGGNREIDSVTVDAHNNVYVGTFFSEVTPSGVDPDMIMKYDGTSWSGLGGGLLRYQGPLDQECTIRQLVTDGTNIFAYGAFIGGSNGTTFVRSPLLIKWDGAEWCSMGGLSEIGLNYQPIDGYYDISSTAALAVLGTNLFVAGNFISVFDVANGYAISNNVGLARFSTLSGALLPCDSLSLQNNGNNYGIGKCLVVHDGTVYVGGRFDAVNSTNAYGIAEWVPGGPHWSSVGGGVTYQGNPAQVSALAANGNAVFAEGLIDSAGTVALGYQDPARWVTAPDPDCTPVLSNDNLADGSYSFDIAGPPGTAWTVYRSVDSSENPIGTVWESIGTAMLFAGTATFTDDSFGANTKCYYKVAPIGGNSDTEPNSNKIGFNFVTIPAYGNGEYPLWVTNSFSYPDSSVDAVIPISAFSGADPSELINYGLIFDIANPIPGVTDWDVYNQGDGWFFCEEWATHLPDESAGSLTFNAGDSLLFWNGVGSDLTLVLHGLVP